VTAALIIGSVAVLVAGFVSFVLYRRTRLRWLPIPDLPEVKYSAPDGINVEHLRRCVRRAIAELVMHAPPVWEPARRLQDIGIVIRKDDVWRDSYGRKVGGTAIGAVVEVGASLSALTHEFAHVIELRATGGTDNAHLLWPGNGLAAADRAYREWLATEGGRRQP
jgi:hypothetical protein